MGKVGVLGGSFDPVHSGHLKLAEYAYRELSLDKVIFIPAYIQPFKAGKKVTDEIHRLNMLKLAIKNYSYFEVSDIEIRLGGKSYTARTLTELKKEYDNLVFIMGADSYVSLMKWYKPEVIFELAEIACAVRDEVDTKDLLALNYPCATSFLKMPRFDASSTDIRKNLLEGRTSDLIDEEVYAYIKENNLYV